MSYDGGDLWTATRLLARAVARFARATLYLCLLVFCAGVAARGLLNLFALGWGLAS